MFLDKGWGRGFSKGSLAATVDSEVLILFSTMTKLKAMIPRIACLLPLPPLTPQATPNVSGGEFYSNLLASPSRGRSWDCTGGRILESAPDSREFAGALWAPQILRAPPKYPQLELSIIFLSHLSWTRIYATREQQSYYLGHGKWT